MTGLFGRRAANADARRSSVGVKDAVAAVARRRSVGQAGSRPASGQPQTPKEVVKRSMAVENGVFLVSPRYTKAVKLGQGSYGVVVSAMDKENNRQRVAIKQVAHAFDSFVGAKHVLREIRMLRLLHHPNILPLLDVDDPVNYRDFSDVYLVTPQMSGDLTDYFRKRNNKPPLDEIRSITCQLFRALKYIHSGNIAHRDIKPGNVLVGDEVTVRLCDLGLARYIDPEEDDVGLTKNVTTKHYRAPEAFLEGDEYTNAIDLWSAGCILYELLARKKIFEGMKVRHQLEAIVTLTGTPTAADTEFLHSDWGKWFLKRMRHHEAVPFKKMLPPGTDDDAIDLVSRLLVFNPANRISAEDALKHPFLLPLHDDAMEPVLDDHIPREAYEPPTVNSEGKKMTKDDMKQLVWNEMLHFHPDAAARYDGK